MSIMRSIRSIAITLLLASVVLTGCAGGRSDQEGKPDGGAPVTTAPPAADTPSVDHPVDSPSDTTATAAPRILWVRTTPPLRSDGFWRFLPAGAGTLVVRVQTANDVQRVRFYLTPTGTGMFDESQLLAQDTNGRDGWSLTWHYREDQFTPVHLTIQASGDGGRTSEIIGIYRPDPTS